MLKVPAQLRPPEIPALSLDDCWMLVENVEGYAIFMLDTDGCVATWNRGAEKINGYTPQEIVGQHFSSFYPPEDIAANKPDRELVIAREAGRVEDEGWRIRKDGGRFWANVVITAIHDEKGRLRGYGKVVRDLSARRRAEEELRRSEERFHALVEGVREYEIYMLDAGGHVATWNAGAEQIKGYTANEVIGRHFSMFFAAEDARAGKPDHELEIARVEGRFEEEGWRVRKDGSRFWANVVVTPLQNRDGALLGFAKVTRDLTSRRDAEEAARQLIREQAARAAAEDAEGRLRDSEARYRGVSHRLEVILEGVADGITVQDRSGAVIFANGAAAKACGFSSVQEFLKATPAEIVGRFEMLDEQGKPFDPQQLPGRRVLRGEESGTAVMHVRDRVSGRDWWSLIRAGAVLDSEGKPELAVNILHDVSAERRSEQRERHLARATEALSSSLDHEAMFGTLARLLVPELADWCSIDLLDGEQLSNVAVAHVDPEKVALANEFQRRYPPDPGQSRGLWSVIRSGTPELLEEISDEMLVRGARDPEHLESLRSIGMRSVIIAPIGSRNHVSGTISLVSAQSSRRYDRHDLSLAEELGRRAGIAIVHVRLYREAQEAARRAEEASRIKDEFLATVSHELRTPLNAIVGWSSLLRTRGLDGGVAQGIEVIHRNAEAQRKIIDDILDVSRIVSGKLRLEPQPANLAAIARDAIEVIRPTAVAKQITIEFAAPSELCLLVADPERLQQVVWNLLSNAVKFTDAGGRVGVTIEQDRSTLVLSVVDTGSGIEPEFLPFVFDRFKQADGSMTRRVGGLGLGLALVRHIVELHGGQVHAQSLGRGTGATFTITLPVGAVAPILEGSAASHPRETSRERRDRPSLGGVRVLVVDDESDARELLRAVLSEAGAVVETASSAAEGLDAIRRFRPEVLVSDIGMPLEDGYSFMQRVRGLDEGAGGAIPSIALTAYARGEDTTRAYAAGFAMHIGKPVTPDDLVLAVGNLAKASKRGIENP